MKEQEKFSSSELLSFLQKAYPLSDPDRIQFMNSTQ